jgi:hypothetical protein
MMGGRLTGRRGRTEAVALLTALLAAASLLTAGGAHADEAVTRAFHRTGAEQTFVVPTGVTTIGVRAIGGAGFGLGFEGVERGAPAEVTGQISVTPGQTLYVEVGGSPTGRLGGFNGGGAGGKGAGGGGGASDVRTAPRTAAGSLNTRLIVAAGSGGGSSTGELGGNAGAEGEPEGAGGKPGTQTKGGLNEEAFECTKANGFEGTREPSTPGALGEGGEGESCDAKFQGGSGGGGGGAGLYGGGGGAGELHMLTTWASGGGGGSSLVPEGGSTILVNAESVIELTYPHTAGPPAVTTGAASSVTAHAASLAGAVDPENSTVMTCTFEYGSSVFYEHSVPCAGEPASGDQPVAVSAAIEGLSGSTTYHYRIVATNGEGTTAGEDAEFTTLVHDPPTVSELSPAVGPEAGGTSVTVTGTELESVTSVRFGETPAAKIEHVSQTTMRVVTPPGPAHTATVKLTDDLGNQVVAGSFRYVTRPVVNKVTPKKGPSGGGTTVVIAGNTGLADVSEVRFGGVHASFTHEGASTLIATSPRHASGKYDVEVISVGGESEPTKKDVFQFAGIEVTGVSPSSGPRAGETSVTVTGVGFAPGSGTTAFMFGKFAATGIECASTTQCTMTAPAAAKAGLVDVRASIVGGKGKSKKSAADHYTYE